MSGSTGKAGPMIGGIVEIGQKVRLKDVFKKEIWERVGKGRIGVVTGHTCFNKIPIVTFPAVGRKKEYQMGQVCERDLEKVDEE